MRIINREAFLALPAGTLYYKYEPMTFGELSIKGDNMGGVDFTARSLDDIVDADGTEQFVELLERGEGGAEVPVCFDNWARDGMFDEGQLFAVLDKDEARRLVESLAKDVGMVASEPATLCPVCHEEAAPKQGAKVLLACPQGHIWERGITFDQSINRLGWIEERVQDSLERDE